MRLEPKRLTFEVGPAEHGLRLDDALARRFSSEPGRVVSKSQARKLIVLGAVRVAGRTVRQPGRRLGPGARVEIASPRGSLGRPREPAFELARGRVLFEDELLIAVDKPAGLPTPPSIDPARPSLVGAVRSYLSSGRAGAEARERPSYLGVHQRLDRDTTGVVLFTKHASANAALAEQFEGRRVVKVYLAWTAVPRGPRPDHWQSSSLLAQGEGRPPRMRVVRAGGQRAVTEFRVLRRLPQAWLVEARPRTGRKHQIRVQLAALGQPILGDVLYGGRTRLGGESVARPLLHALRLELRHPASGASLRIESPPPDDFSRAERLAGRRAAPRASSSRR